MQANWSLILNILLLIVVIVAIVRLIKVKRQNTTISRSRERSMSSDSGKAYGNPTAYGDDIIAVRKINDKEIEKKVRDTTPQSTSESPMPRLIAEGEESLEACKNTSSHVSSRNTPNFTTTEKTLMMFLLARENRQFAGYELLQTVLAAGLRFGDDGLFHRHQFPNGDGDIICSLASATAAGTFDLQNIGAFSVRGLCLYMHLTTNTQVNKDHFTLMLNTANLLAEGLDAHLLDENRQPITEERLEQYQEYLHQEIDFA